MKVVLFCGGLGMRLKEYSEIIPKPMINIGYRPILWYVMKYYAHFGHKEFILCLGYKADIIKNYFLNYNEYMSNDFTMSGGGKDLALKSSDIQDWKITFVDTGPPREHRHAAEGPCSRTSRTTSTSSPTTRTGCRTARCRS
jgi:glucose-1-phosphate cytidylyltransferase